MKRLLLFAILALVPSALEAQSGLSEQQALGVLVPIEGISSYTREMRDAIANDPAIMTLYADVLEGRRPGPRGWQASTVIWWLAESRDPQYLEIFERYAATSEDPGEIVVAIYGLARHIDRPSARRSLEDLAEAGTDRERASVALALTYVNTPAARTILRTLESQDLPGWIAAKRDSALAGPALQNEIGRGPCLQGEVRRGDSSGVVRCIPVADS